MYIICSIGVILKPVQVGPVYRLGRGAKPGAIGGRRNGCNLYKRHLRPAAVILLHTPRVEFDDGDVEYDVRYGRHSEQDREAAITIKARPERREKPALPVLVFDVSL